jgi:hypothetical protein
MDMEKMMPFGIQTALGAAQTVYGAIQAKKARNRVDELRANAPSYATPAEFYEQVKEAYNQRLVERQYEEMNRQLATTISALQGAGGRALVGGVNEATRQKSVGMENIALRQNQMQNEALGGLAAAREREIGRSENRYQQDLGFEMDNLRAAYEQIAGGAGAMASGIGYGAMANSLSKRI